MFDSFFPYNVLTVTYENDPAFHKKTTTYRIKTKAGNYVIDVEEYIEDMFVMKHYPVRLKHFTNKVSLSPMIT